MILRPYQERAVAELRAVYASGKRAPVLVMPTGSGKTPTAAEIIRLSLARGKRVLFAAGRIELLGQAIAKLGDAGIADVRVIRADADQGNLAAPVTVASVPTLATPRWANCLPDADLVVLDECHHAKAETWAQIAYHYARAWLLGLTATPARGDGRALGDIFDAIVVGASVRELMDLGHLVEARVFAPGRVLESRELALEPLEAYERHCTGMPTIVFAQTKQHARSIAASFEARGLRTGLVFGDSANRTETLAAFAEGGLDVLIGVSVFVEGWDAPRAGAAIFARKFTHVGPYLQAIGRVLRPFEGKREAVVVDLVGSALVHGTPDLARSYSLSGAGISKSANGAIYRCIKCGGVQLAASRGACRYCGHVQPALERAKPKSLSEQLHEVTKDFEPREWNVRHARGTRLCVECGRAIVNKAKYVYVNGGPSLHPQCVFAKARKLAAARSEAA